MPVRKLTVINQYGFALLCILFVAAPLLAVNAADGAEQNKHNEIMSQMLQKSGQGSDASPTMASDDPARPKSLPESSSDPLTSQLYEKALQDYYSYRSEGLQHRRAVFKWQLFSAKLIFAIVLLLVGSGVVFAAIQFRQGMQERNTGSGDKDQLSTEMEISSSGIKITSPVIGVIILTLSLGFFYLYLVHVYPIENIF